MIQDISNRSMEELVSSPHSPLSKMKKTRYNRKMTPQKTFLNQSISKSISITTTQQAKQCRICLDDSCTDQNNLLEPCNCTGSVRYVHNDCYKQWIEKQFAQKSKLQRDRMIKTGIECELCKSKIYLQFNTRMVCTTCDSFCSKINATKFFFVIFVLLLIMNMGSLAYLIIFSKQSFSKFSKYITINLVLISILLFLGMIFLIALFNFFRIYVVQYKTQLHKFSKFKQPARQINRNQVHPEVVQIA